MWGGGREVGRVCRERREKCSDGKVRDAEVARLGVGGDGGGRRGTGDGWSWGCCVMGRVGVAGVMVMLGVCPCWECASGRGGRGQDAARARARDSAGTPPRRGWSGS